MKTQIKNARINVQARELGMVKFPAKGELLKSVKKVLRNLAYEQREAEQNGYERNRIVRLEYAAPWKKARALQEVKSRRAWKRDRGMATLPLPC